MKVRQTLIASLSLAAIALAGCSSTQSARSQNDARVTGTSAREAGLSDRWVVQKAEPAIARTETPTTVATREPVTAPATSCSTATTGVVSLGKTVPKEVTLGETYSYDLAATANNCAGNVVISDQIPAGASFVRSEPQAELQGDRLVWRLGSMDPGQSRNIKVWLKAEREGTLASCATIAADPRVCAETFVGRATLALTKTGPETAIIGTDVTYNLVVSNTGTAVARGVVVTDQVPDGLTSPTGQSQLTFNVGDLAPRESKTIPVTLKAARRGRFCNTAIASSGNAGRANAEACTTVLQPGLKIVKTGDKEQFLFRNASYRIVVSNTGDTTLTGVVVTDSAPASTRVVSASGASISGNQAVWNVGSLNAGEEKSFDVVLTSSTPGNACNTVAVATTQGLRDSSEACTLWRGISALLLEKGDDPDPIQIGQNITYYVRVTNQGTADDTNVKVVVEFPKELTPVSADNGGVVRGQTVTFPPFPRLAPKQAFEFRVIARGNQAGDARVTFIRTSDGIPAPTTAEESTRVY